MSRIRMDLWVRTVPVMCVSFCKRCMNWKWVNMWRQKAYWRNIQNIFCCGNDAFEMLVTVHRKLMLGGFVVFWFSGRSCEILAESWLKIREATIRINSESKFNETQLDLIKQWRLNFIAGKINQSSLISQFVLCSMATNSQRQIAEFPWEFLWLMVNFPDGTFLNDSLLWLKQSRGDSKTPAD